MRVSPIQGSQIKANKINKATEVNSRAHRPLFKQPRVHAAEQTTKRRKMKTGTSPVPHHPPSLTRKTVVDQATEARETENVTDSTPEMSVEDLTIEMRDTWIAIETGP